MVETVIASEAKQSQNLITGLPRRCAPRNDKMLELSLLNLLLTLD
jgi:hypothetical protein